MEKMIYYKPAFYLFIFSLSGLGTARKVLFSLLFTLQGNLHEKLKGELKISNWFPKRNSFSP